MIDVADVGARARSALSPGLGKVRRVLEAEGPTGVLHRVARKLASPMVDFGSIELFVRNLRGPVPGEAESADGIALRLGTPADVEAILAGADRTRDIELLHDRFHRGDLCFVAVEPDGGVAHSRWVTTGRAFIPELDADLVLSPADAYMYDGYTRPDMRRRGLDGRIRCFIFRRMKETGRRRVLSCVRGDNPGGLRAARRWQQSAGRVGYVRLGKPGRVLRRARGLLPSLRLGKPTAEGGRYDAGGAEARARAWRRWFESWTDKSLEERSTGTSALPHAYFADTAELIARELHLSPRHDRVLDVGCDSTALSRHVAPRCRSLVGVDFVHELITGSGEPPNTGAGEPMRLITADGRLLPFADHAFDKIYCSGVLHTLPDMSDGLRMLGELVRVCRPGGAVLVAAIPDRRKRSERYRELWRRGTPRQRLRLALGLLAPAPLRRLARRVLGLDGSHGLAFLEYDLGELERLLAAWGLEGTVLDFPPDHWSRDFRATRSNLLIRIPTEAST